MLIKKLHWPVIHALIQGAGDSGKSTIAKQMKIIHLDGFSDEERLSYKTTIANNILTSMRTLIHQSGKFEYPLSKGNEVCCNCMMLLWIFAYPSFAESCASSGCHASRPRTKHNKRNSRNSHKSLEWPGHQTNIQQIQRIPAERLHTIVTIFACFSQVYTNTTLVTLIIYNAYHPPIMFLLSRMCCDRVWKQRVF